MPSIAGGVNLTLIELLILSIGLSMDAFAVSICKGLSIKKVNIKNMFIIGACFGFFQAFMPVLGFLLGIKFKDIITPIDHWVAFILLSGIGLNMIKEVFSNNRLQTSSSIKPREMIILSIATSIDALVVGITLAFLNVNIIYAALFIGLTTLVISIVGVKIGSAFGNMYEKKAEVFGGIILIIFGIKILFQHLLGF